MLLRGGIVYIQALFHMMLPYQKVLNFISFFLGQPLIWMRFTDINIVMYLNGSVL